MAAIKPLTTEAIALTEKKMDMTLDDIIKMSKKTTTKEKRPPRPLVSREPRFFFNGSASCRNTVVLRFMDSRSSIRQGVLAQRRSNFRGNQFPLTMNVARKAAVVPICNVMVNRNKQRIAPALKPAEIGSSAGKDKLVLLKQRPQTIDALFANMKQQRMRVFSAQQSPIHANSRQTSQRRRSRQQQQQRGGIGGAAPCSWFGKSAK